MTGDSDGGCLTPHAVRASPIQGGGPFAIAAIDIRAVVTPVPS